MFELAYNVNGEPFEVPPTMAAWRVRKLKPKGAPEVVYGRDGLPLFLPMDADIEDLRREARGDGRYRLDPVDEHNRPVPNAPSGYVCVHPIERAPEPAAPAQPPAATGQVEITHALVAALLESQRQHTELARMYVSQFPVVSNAMAGMVRTAGDVGLTARVPLVVPAAPEAKPDNAAQPEAETDDDEIESDEIESDEIDTDQVAVAVAPQPEYSWARVAQTFADHVTPHVGPLLAGLPGLAAMLGARRDSTASDAARGPDRTTDPAPAEAAVGAPSVPAAGFDAGMLVRLNAIKARLTPAEQQFAHMLIDEIPPEDLPIWFGRLRSMSLDEAVAYVREKFREGQAAAASARTAEPSAATAPSAAPRSAPPRAAVRSTAPSAPRDARRDGRRPMPSPISESASHAAPPTARHMTRRPTPTNGLGLLDEGTQAHLAAIDRALTLDEAAELRKQFAALSPRERASWVATLVMLPVTDAVAAIRAQLAAADASVAGPNPANASIGSVPLAASVVATTPTPSAAVSRDEAISADASEPAAGDATTPSTHDLPPTALAIAPLVESTTSPAAPAPVVIDRSADMHLSEVESALTPDERVRMHAMFSRLSPDERDVWLDKLLSAPPSQGTAMLRDALGDGNTQPATTAPAISGAPVTIATASDDEPQAPEHASAQHEPRVEITELDETADLEDTADLDQVADLDEAAELDDIAEIIELDETADLKNGPTRASGPMHISRAADDATLPRDTDHPRAATVANAPESTAPEAKPATAEPDPGKHLAAIEAALTLAEKMRAHELAAQRPAAELRRWYAELLRLSVPEAVARIRAELARSDADPNATKKGGVS